MHPRSLRHGNVNDCVATWATVVVVPAIILRENWALPPPMMPAMAETATGLQMGGLQTTRARRTSVHRILTRLVTRLVTKKLLVTKGRKGPQAGNQVGYQAMAW